MTWVNSSDRRTLYLFYQGVNNNQTALTRFIGPHLMYTSTGEVGYSRRAIHTIPRDNAWIYPELDEIDRTPTSGGVGHLLLLQRGISVKRTKDMYEYIPPYPTDEAGSVSWYGIHRTKASLGQETDIANHQKRYAAMMNPEFGHALPEDVVLYGVSRGAATSFAALSKNKHLYQNVKLCILEAPPATISSVIKNYLGLIGKWLYIRKFLNAILGKKHRPEKQSQAIAYVNEFPDHVPLLIISAKDDPVVPHKGSLNLAMAVAAKRIKKIEALAGDSTKIAQIQPVYFLQLDQGGHSVSVSNAESSKRYQSVVHAIYKKHGLPYIEAYACACVDDIAEFELTRGVLTTQVALQDQFKNNKDKERRESIQKAALDDLRHIHATNKGHDYRSLEICTNLSIYRKSLEHCFFGKTALQKEIDCMKNESYPMTNARATA